MMLIILKVTLLFDYKYYSVLYVYSCITVQLCRNPISTSSILQQEQNLMLLYPLDYNSELVQQKCFAGVSSCSLDVLSVGESWESIIIYQNILI